MIYASFLSEVNLENIGVIITAIATVSLWWVTKTLAVETRRLAEAGSQPHIVVTLEANRWSLNHFDIWIANTGNATAYDIKVAFDPPLENGAPREDRTIPFQQVSVLKPGKELSSYLSDFAPLQGKSYRVSVSWQRNPANPARESNIYLLSMSDVEGVSKLGTDPIVQLATEVKHIREDWRAITQGTRRIHAEVYTRVDRNEERARVSAMREAAKERSANRNLEKAD